MTGLNKHGGPVFSRRTAWETAESPWAVLLRARREAGLPVLDLTVSNPTRCGFEYDAETVLGALGGPAAMDYDPDPQGMLGAREAVCRYYLDHGARVEAGKVFLTTSTSEAYSFLFRLLCDPGEEVLIAQPSYPLFDFLADLDDVRLVTYPLFYDYGWHIDFAMLRERITPRTRAVAVVNPNNPTGHFTRAAAREQLEAICLEHGLALIVDEVFLDYPVLDYPIGADPFKEGPGASFASGEHPVLTFVLSGLSKVAALPQMKAAWIVCCGPAVAEAKARLEVISDTFLSMNAPVQLALPGWLAGRAGVQAQIRQRVAANLAELDRQLSGQSLVGRLEVEAGWSVVLTIRGGESSELVALRLLLDLGVAVHGGELFGFGEAGRLVLSLLTAEVPFAEGVASILPHISEMGRDFQC